MPPTDTPLAKIPDTEEPTSGDFSSAHVARLLRENARLREENRILRAQAITNRKEAHYYKAMHGKAAGRLLEKDGQIESLKSKVCELAHRLFGRKSERGKGATIGTTLIGPKRKRGQQHGASGHGRKMRKELPVVEVEVLPPAAQTFCAHCNKPWVPMGCLLYTSPSPRDS